MTIRMAVMRMSAGAMVLGVAAWALPASAQLMIVGVDNKVIWDEGGKMVTTPADKDAVVVVDIAERDLDARIEFCAMGNGIFSQPHYIANCDTHINVASTDALTLADVATHPTCDAYGIVSIDPETRCVRIETGDPGHGEARFWTVISFDVLN